MKAANKDILFLSLIIVFSFLLSACSTTSLVTRWSDPDFKGPVLKKILVIGIIKDDIKRRSFEEEFARLITTADRSGVASYTVLPDLESADRKEDVLAAVEKTGADGVLVVTLQGVSKEKRDVPPSIDYVPTIGFGYGMYGYYGASHAAVYRPGYTVTDTVVRLDTKLFNAATKKMIWAGKTESFNPASAQIVVNELAKLLMTDMKKSGMVK
ncbi:MAG: hypothetical protein BMS9Abin25_0308 [Gammaproteobacteria bacterium]|nr:MAG: hypothetical protein BMS9Abin25_0308 [Gammaproteobacteria bacterium]